jgi:integrase
MAKGVRRWRDKWQLRATVAGKAHTRTVNLPDTQAGLRKAEKIRAAWVQDLRKGLDKGPCPTFGVLAQAYLNQADLKHSTYHLYRRTLNQVWMPEFATKLVDQIKPAMIRKILKDYRVTSKTKRNSLIPLRKVFELGIEEEYIDANPVDPVKVRRHQKPPIIRFTPIEKQKILSRLDGDAHLFYLIAFETGMRTGEILGLMWEDWSGDTINLVRSVVRRRVSSLKTYSVRSVHVSPVLRSALTGHPARFRGGYMFTTKSGGHNLDDDKYRNAWHKALKDARVTYRRPYTCRHTRASEMLMAGIEPAFAARQLGHSIQMFLTVYADWIDGVKDTQQKDLLNAIGE